MAGGRRGAQAGLRADELVVEGGALTLNVYAWPTIAWAAAGAVLLWTPPASRYFLAWRARRHPEQVFAPPTTNVYYGPLPRYRTD